MRLMKTSLAGGVAFWGFFLLTALVHAGGPLFFNETDGEPFRWFNLDSQNQRIFRAVFYVETGGLGKISNQVAAKAARDAFATWEKVPTADLQIQEILDVPPDKVSFFRKDISRADFFFDNNGDGKPNPFTCNALGPDRPFLINPFECELIRQCVLNNLINCPSPVIFDSDGGIFDALGVAASVIGFSGPLLVLPIPLPGPPPSQLISILQARVFINGLFFDGDPNTPRSPDAPPLNFIDDPKGDRFLPGILTHEIGHFLGLAHSVVNGNPAAFNPSVSSVGTSTRGRLDPSIPVDALVSVSLKQVETMFPLALVTQDEQLSFSNFLKGDDEVALSTLYPCTAQARAAGNTCTQDFFASTGTISGKVFIQNTSRPAQGVVVIGRRVDDPNTPDSVLATAVSQLTGATFAPRRCLADLDLNGDGNTDISGLLGPCAVPGFPSAECSTRFPNAVGPTQCGFVSFGLTPNEVRPIPSDQENLYVLQGLPPGEYIVQAIQTVIGGYSSPVRSSFDPSTAIRSDDNVLLNFFPNPQTGEFYNGPANGCGASSTPCGNETGDRADNPFAFTRIKVAAGSPAVENVNIFLNASDSVEAILSDPGFDYCGLGDVNADGTVSEDDILAVVMAKDAFDRNQILNKRADINGDGAVTFLDIDAITDIVASPRPFVGSTAQEIIRGLAPFEAICSAAKGRCRIQAPVETSQEERTQICQTAKAIGCQVIDCP